MGLFGYNWDWEELQKKDAIMGELRKENDRVLSEQERILYENTMSIEDIERAEAGQRLATRSGKMRKLYRKLYNSYSIANIINKDYKKGYFDLSIKSKYVFVKRHSKGSLYSIIAIWCGIFIALGFITTFAYEPLGCIELLILYLITLFFLKFIPAIINHKKMLNNACYKEIKNNINSQNIVEIGIIQDRLRVINTNRV